MIGMVYRSCLVRSIWGRNSWFQLVTNANIACVAIAGFIMGSTIWLKIRNSPAPSIRPDWSISIGRDGIMYCLMKNTVAGAWIEGSISARKLLVIPIWYMNW